MDAANVDLKAFTEEFCKPLCTGLSASCSIRSST
jgi:pyruvate-formate lyase-activating enzyme